MKCIGTGRPYIKTLKINWIVEWNNTSAIRKNWALEWADTNDVKEENSKRPQPSLNKKIVKALGVLGTATLHRADNEGCE